MIKPIALLKLRKIIRPVQGETLYGNKKTAGGLSLAPKGETSEKFGRLFVGIPTVFLAIQGETLKKFPEGLTLYCWTNLGRRSISALMTLALLLPSVVVFPKTAYAANVAIRQEINLIDGYFTAAIGNNVK